MVGTQRWFGSECVGPLKRSGATPTMVNGAPFTISLRPITAGSASRRRCHRSWLMTTTGCAQTEPVARAHAGQGTCEHCLRHREEGGVRADAQRERKDGGQREGGASDQLPDCVADVLKEGIHR